jgi:hypothetical protein
MRRRLGNFLKDGRARAAALLALGCLALAGCRAAQDALSVRPRTLRDVPAARLAFRFEPDLPEDALPEPLKKEEAEEPLSGVKADFETRRNAEALMRTVVSPTGQRALALYGTSETDTDFRIDLYGSGGNFVRNVLPQDLTGVFPAEVEWSPDGGRIAFAGIRSASAQATPTPADALPPPADALPPPGDPSAALTPTPAAPIIAPVQTFKTEQIYVGNSDGFDLRPLTTKEGLIYFKLAWSPDGQSIAALACREDEWEARKAQGKAPAGRPRVVTLEGQERLLDDRLTDVAPVWSPDGSKVATAFDFDVAVYDAAGGAPTAAGLPLADPLRSASKEYDKKILKKDDAGKNGNAGGEAGKAGGEAGKQGDGAQPTPAGEEVIISLNPFVRLEWLEPETLFAQTAYVRFFQNEPVPVVSYKRWHVLKLYPQAALLE